MKKQHQGLNFFLPLLDSSLKQWWKQNHHLEPCWLCNSWYSVMPACSLMYPLDQSVINKGAPVWSSRKLKSWLFLPDVRPSGSRDSCPAPDSHWVSSRWPPFSWRWTGGSPGISAGVPRLHRVCAASRWSKEEERYYQTFPTPYLLDYDISFLTALPLWLNRGYSTVHGMCKH